LLYRAITELNRLAASAFARSLKPVTGSSTLFLGGGCFLDNGTGCAGAFATVFGLTLYCWANPRPETVESIRRSRRIRP
jgi:hypothetical protein